MKIRITTFQWADNYGALLQAHALQSFLQQRGHEVQIVNYRPHKPGSLLRRWLSVSPRGCVRKWEQQWKRFLFELFRREHFNRTPEVFRSSSELWKISDRFDLLITGSDQVWNPQWISKHPGLFDLFFLSFAGSKTRRISYAASIGHSDLSTLAPEWQRMLAEKMKAMHAISVREQSGVELVRQLCGRTDAVCVADPTLLLAREHYDKLAGRPGRRPPYLFSFMLHGLEQDAAGICRTISGQLGLKTVRCNATKTGLHAGYTLPAPQGWLRTVRDAQFIVTNSFHCTVFCLIFHVPFIAVLVGGKLGAMNSRIIDLLEPVGLSHRIVSPEEADSDELLSEGIDWQGADRGVEEARLSAVEFLKMQGV
jgi:hypothetical protein